MAQKKERGIYNFATPRDGLVTLQWHFRNEYANRGCLDLQPCYDSRHFSIIRWLNPDGGWHETFYDIDEPMRYSEADEFGYETWECRMHPWERLQEKITVMPEFHTRQEIERYVTGILDSIIDDNTEYDHLQVVDTPYNGHPLVCIIRDNKVTIL